MEVVVGDRRVPYLLKGSQPNTIVFLPALGTEASVWEETANRFADRYTVVALETGGHSGTPERIDLNQYADDVRAVLDAVGSTWAHLVGLSLGGMVAQEFALAQPDRVRSLTLVNTTSRLPPEVAAVYRDRAKKVEIGGISPILESTLARWFTADFLSSNSATVQRVRGILEQADPASYAAAARAIANVSTYDRLGAIAAPTLVIHGSEDASMPPGASEEIAQRVQQGRVAVMDGLSHMAPIQDPEAFIALLEPFLREADEDAMEDPARIEPVHPW
jgi:3-oxoadipate enol-lactonase